MKIEVTHIGVYRAAQVFNEISTQNLLSLVISGLRRHRINGRDYSEQQPFFTLLHKGARIDAAYGADRENWVVMLRQPVIAAAARPDWVTLSDGEREVPMPRVVNVPKALVTGWRAEFERCRAAFSQPTPLNVFRVETAVMNMFRFMIDSVVDFPLGTVAGKLKERIDRDERFERSLEELGRSCGYSADHGRLLFEREFHISPGKYRSRKRLAAAMKLIAESDLFIKEIAESLGFSNLSAFTAFFRRETGFSPSEALARYRNAPRTAK